MVHLGSPNILILSVKIDFVLANRANPDELRHCLWVTEFSVII